MTKLSRKTKYIGQNYNYPVVTKQNEYLDEGKESCQKYFQKKRKQAIKKAEHIYNHGTYQYFCKISNHAYTKRSSAKETRLTLPKKAVYDLLRYLLKSEESYEALQQKLINVKDEKQLALVFYNRDRSHLVGLLVAFNISIDGLMVITVITMYDNIPQDKSAQKFLFPKVERITLYDYDLGEVMDQYDEQEKEKEEIKEVKRKEQLNRNRQTTRITRVSSLDEYYAEDHHHIKKVNCTSRSTGKIRKVKVEKTYVNTDMFADEVQSTQLATTTSERLQERSFGWFRIKISQLLGWIKSCLSSK